MNSSARKVAGLRVGALMGALVSLAAVAPAWGIFDEQKKGEAAAEAPAATPEAQAALDAGLAAVRDGEWHEANEGGGKGGKLAASAKKYYTDARARFDEATQADPKLAQAWNGLGYTSRKLGDYKSSLAAYDKALEIRPGYPEATEYRGEAYLGLGRLEDAKQAYLDLFAENRDLAGKLLAAMKTWTESKGKKKADVADLREFIEEREKIAAQTASLTRETATQGWN